MSLLRPKQSRSRRLWCGGPVLAAVTGGAVLAMSTGCADPAERPTRHAKVGTVEAIEAPVPDQSVFIGEVRAKHVVDLKPMVTGNVTKRAFEAGQQVSEGDVLYEIDIRPFKAAASEAAAQLARARAARDNARSEAARADKLIASGAISSVQHENMTSKRDVADAEFKAAQAALATTKLDLDFAEVKSPIDGVVDVPRADVGTLVKPSDGEPMVRVTQLDPIYVYSFISERKFLAVQARRRRAEVAGESPEQLVFRVRLADGSMYPHEGVLDYLAPEMDRNTGSFEFRIKLPNEERLLKPGQYAEVVVGSAEPKPRVLIPRKAIVRGQAGSFVYVVNDQNLVEERAVTLGRISRDLQVVLEGVDAGERVISSGVQMARPGAEVEARALQPIEFVPEGVSAEGEGLEGAVTGRKAGPDDGAGDTDGEGDTGGGADSNGETD